MANTLNALTTGGGGLATTADSSGAITFQKDGTATVAIDANGNVGIGTSSPATLLHISSGNPQSRVQSTGTGYAIGSMINTNSTFLYGVDNAAGGLSSAANSTFFLNQNATPMLFMTNNTERMRIDSSGNVLVGGTATNPVASRVNGTNIQAIGGIKTRSGAGESYVGISATSGVNLYFYTDNGSAFVAAGNISSNGGTTSYNASSDYRMKENISPMVNALDKISLLNPVTYDWKDEFAGTNKNGQGFIAHELQEIFPDAVTGEKDAVDEEGNPIYQGIDTSFLVATLTAAIQEQQAIITDLKARIEVLEAK